LVWCMLFVVQLFMNTVRQPNLYDIHNKQFNTIHKIVALV